MEKHNKGYLYGMIAVLIWTGFILVSRMGGLSELGADDVIVIRYLTCTAIVLPLWWFRFRFKLLSLRLFLTSLVGGLAYALFTFNGFQLAPASHAAILLPGLMPFFIILFGIAITREKVSNGRWLGVGLITAGIVGLFFQQLAEGGQYIGGDLCLIAGSLCWALFSVLIKRWDITPWQVTVSLAFYTTLIYVPVYLLFLSPNLRLELWEDIALQALYQGILATIVQMIFYVRAVQLIGPPSMGALMAMVPVLSGVAAIIALGEAATIEIFVALVLVSAGALCASGMSLELPAVFRKRRVRPEFNVINKGE